LSIDENSQFEGSSRRVENPTEPSSSVDTKGPQKKDMQSPASAPLPFIERSTLPVVPPDTSRSRHVAFEAKPENLIGDRAYDSDPPDEELRRDGIEMIAPDRANRSKPPTQDRRRLTRYMRRWLVERFFAWIQWQRWNPRPLGVLYPEFPGLCSTRLLRYPLQAILR
jgi:DDE family transposase